MINRFPVVRTLSAVALLLAVISTPAGAQTTKRRAVSPHGSANATLNGVVTDATTGAPVVQVLVSGPNGPVAQTDPSGKFAAQMATGRDVTLTFVRTGYQTLTTTVNISGTASRSFQMTPKATTAVRTVSGTTSQLDTETIEFGYIAPFSGYVKDSKLNLCAAGGASFTPDRADIQKITGPAQLNDAACCKTGPLPAINVQLKSGGTTTGGFVDACVGYQVDIIGRDHTTNAPVYIHFANIAEVDFP